MIHSRQIWVPPIPNHTILPCFIGISGPPCHTVDIYFGSTLSYQNSQNTNHSVRPDKPDMLLKHIKRFHNVTLCYGSGYQKKKKKKKHLPAAIRDLLKSCFQSDLCLHILNFWVQFFPALPIVVFALFCKNLKQMLWSLRKEEMYRVWDENITFKKKNTAKNPCSHIVLKGLSHAILNYSQLSLNGLLYKTDTSIKRTPGADPGRFSDIVL